MLRKLLILTLAVLSGPAAANTVSDMRVVGDAERTRFVVDLQKNPDFGLLRLASPYRLVIDMPKVEFRELAKASEGRGLISEFRYGLIAPGKARIVLDLSGPVEIVNTFVLDPVESEPSRLVIDMIPTTASAFEVAAAQDRPDRSTTASIAPTAVDPSGPPVVVIDPGHGGIDSGAIGADGLLEKDVTLQFAVELARQLKLRAKLQPVLTRSGDDFLSLGERVEVAQRHHAAFFVSVHADSVAEDYVRGATVYTLSDDASDALAAAMAERENRSDVLAGLALDDQPDDVADILFDLTRRETKNLAIRFARALVDDLDGAIPLNANPWRRAAFRVLKAPDVPSVLLELGYLSNKEDESLFRAEGWPASHATKIAVAIEEFFGESVTAGQ
ncbi:MAG: N-acetylmuramoyl-L-alanine amidase [Rhizobiales bacterium]|nr:N-acetylmuramoyl-L-alanine amidase [Hyphomicrobiales bacterium]